ncbi:MAG: SusD/RagB family nutrient-binding outer membrane lipoprotein, partial [Bacteroidota bacterium]
MFKKIALAVLVLSMAACADLDELLINPNGVGPENADATSLYNNIQDEFRNVFTGTYGFTGGLSRMDAETGGFRYDETHAPTEFNGLWFTVYSDLFPDIDAFLELVQPLGLDAAAASAKIMKAYSLMLMVDMFNDVPLSEAGLGVEGQTNPGRDGGAEVYDAAIALLDEAIAQLDGADDFDVAFDNFYGGKATEWAAFAKTLKLRAAVNTRLVNGAGGVGTVNALVSEGDIITANGGNFEWQYGTNRVNPNNRHFFYNGSYENNDGPYQSNWYMWLLAESKGFEDPRARYYFFRQARNVFPDLAEDDPNAFDCILTDVPDPEFLPDHYAAISEDMPYCLGSYSKGYFGRDHLNGSGIPPDGNYRTVYGLYPGGGKFDDGATNGVVQNAGTDGALGAGILPIWQASFTHFILAEAVLEMGADGDARQLLSDAIQLSMDRVTSFESLVDGSEVIATTPTTVTVEETFAADSTITQYIDFVLAEYDEADDNGKLGIVAREYLIALWGNGMDSYNLYRRTCLPADMQPGIDPNYGTFLRSALYPLVHIERNINATQKEGEIGSQPVSQNTG